MQTYHFETIVTEKGVLNIKGLPFHPGQKVEIILKSRYTDDAAKNNRYSLRGKHIKYENPFDSVAGDEWGVIPARSATKSNSSFINHQSSLSFTSTTQPETRRRRTI